MTGVDADLATLRDSLTGSHSGRTARGLDALARVEAELSRLREQRDALERENNSVRLNEQATNHARVNDNAYLIARAEAAEARCARLQQALREIEEYRYPLNGTLEAIVAMKALAREALAGPDTPAEEEA